MQILEGAQYRLRVKLTNKAGAQLPPELFRVYAGAFCPGYAPAHFHAERTAEEWVLTMPGLKPGRVPWNWQVIAAEYATGVEWLLAAGEVTVTPRHATGSGYVDPGELKITATLDKTTLQMTVQVGESTSACSLAVVDARNSAQAAANSAEHAAEHAEAADKAAQTAGEKATEAGASATAAEGSATAAAASATAAAKSADSAASTLNAAAKKAENNTFTGTNTFNGVLVANQGVKVNYVEPAYNSVLPSNAMSTIGLLNESLIKEIDVKGSLVSSTGKFSEGLELSGGTAEAPAVMQKTYYNSSFHNSYKTYAEYHSLILPIEFYNCDFRVMLVMNSTNRSPSVQYTDITKPFLLWERMSVTGTHEHFHVFEVYGTYQSGQQSIHCTTRWREGDNVLGVREFGCRLNTGSLSSNYTGITHLFFMKESNGVGLYVLFSSPSIKFMRVGCFDSRGSSLYRSSETRMLLVGATGSVKLKNIKMTAAISGVGYPNFPYPLSVTYDAYENLLTFEEYKQKYGLTDATE